MTPTETIEQENAAAGQPAENQQSESNTNAVEDHGEAHQDHAGHGQDHAGHSHDPASLSHEAQPTLNPALMREVSVEVDAETVSKAFRTVVKKYQKLARIPGFRVGKVPESVIKSRFAKDVRQEVLDQLVSERFRQTLVEQNLSPASQPQLTNLMLVDGQPLQFKAAFEVLPEIELAGYDTIEVARPQSSLTEAEYHGELERMMDSHGTVETIEEDRTMVDGDWAEIEFKGVMQDLAQKVGEEGVENTTESEPITGEDVLIEVGGKNTLPAFSDALRGAKVGQEMSFEVTYPADFGEPRLAGQTVKYDVTVKALKKKTYPEKDAELARMMGDYESWEAFETDLRARAGQRKKEVLENQAKEKMLNELLSRYDFAVPETFVQQQIDARLDRGLRALANQGMTPEDMRKLDFNGLRAAQREQAIGEVRTSLLLDRIAEQEGVQVEEEEMERELMIASMQAREPLDTLRNRMLEDGSLDRMREQMRREKTASTLFEKVAK